MSANTSIQWTDRTWNPVRGCSRVSARFADVRELVRAASSCGLSVQLLLGVLTITIQCRDEMLDEREMVAAEVRRLRPDESQWEGLLGGLVPNVSGPVASSPGTGQVSRG